VAAVKYEASAMGRIAYEALEGNAARIADALQHAVDRAKRDAGPTLAGDTQSS